MYTELENASMADKHFIPDLYHEAANTSVANMVILMDGWFLSDQMTTRLSLISSNLKLIQAAIARVMNKQVIYETPDVQSADAFRILYFFNNWYAILLHTVSFALKIDPELLNTLTSMTASSSSSSSTRMNTG